MLGCTQIVKPLRHILALSEMEFFGEGLVRFTIGKLKPSVFDFLSNVILLGLPHIGGLQLQVGNFFFNLLDIALRLHVIFLTIVDVGTCPIVLINRDRSTTM